MNQLLKVWRTLTRVQQLSLVVLPVLFAAGLFYYARWRHESEFKPLYSSLAPEDAAAVTQKMRESSIEYRLDETGTSVLVPSTKIAEARLALAGAGLPKSGRIGFELFDRTNIGASDFAEQVNYRRALEGELERTVATMSPVEQARIHITFGKDSVFLDSRQPSKATVVLHLKRLAQLPQGSVAAIANLVASAVDGLAPDAVAIIDSGGRLLNRPRQNDDSDAHLAESNLDYRRRIETELLSRINTALEPLLGENHFRTGINVDCDFSTSDQSEEIVDPTKSAVLTTQSSEESTGAATASGGIPGTATNLPRPVTRTASAGAAGISRRTENVSYQSSKTVRRVSVPKGSIRRVSAAILIDQTVRWDGVGKKIHKVLVPPSPEVLKGVRNIVAGITGFTEQRGDQITVETVPFESTLSAEPPTATIVAPMQGTQFDQKTLLTAVGGIAVVLILAGALVFFLRGRRGPAISVENTGSTALPAHAGESAVAKTAAAGATPTDDSGVRMNQHLLDAESEQAQMEAEAMSRIKLPKNSKATEVLLKHVRETVHKDPPGTTNVLRAWVAEADSKRKA